MMALEGSLSHNPILLGLRTNPGVMHCTAALLRLAHTPAGNMQLTSLMYVGGCPAVGRDLANH